MLALLVGAGFDDGASLRQTSHRGQARTTSAMRSRSQDLGWFYNQVKNKGPWHYKQQGAQYQDFGNLISA